MDTSLSIQRIAEKIAVELREKKIDLSLSQPTPRLTESKP